MRFVYLTLIFITICVCLGARHYVNCVYSIYSHFHLHKEMFKHVRSMVTHSKKHKKLEMELEHWWTIGDIHGLMSRGLITHGVRGRSPSRTSVTAGAAKVDNFYSALLKQPCSVGSILVGGFHSTAITEKKTRQAFQLGLTMWK